MFGLTSALIKSRNMQLYIFIFIKYIVSNEMPRFVFLCCTSRADPHKHYYEFVILVSTSYFEWKLWKQLTLRQFEIPYSIALEGEKLCFTVTFCLSSIWRFNGDNWPTRCHILSVFATSVQNPVVARSKAYVCGLSLTGFAGSSTTGGRDVSFLWMLCVVR